MPLRENREESKEGGLKLSEENQFIIFNMDGEEFGIEITRAHEIVRMQGITELPQSSDFIEGIVNLRGEIITIIDLRKRFYMEGNINDQTRIIIIDIAEMKTGIMVDSISGVIRIDADSISDPPGRISGIHGDYIQGIGRLDGRLIILLDLNQIFSSEELEEIKIAE